MLIHFDLRADKMHTRYPNNGCLSGQLSYSFLSVFLTTHSGYYFEARHTNMSPRAILAIKCEYLLS